MSVGLADAATAMKRYPRKLDGSLSTPIRNSRRRMMELNGRRKKKFTTKVGPVTLKR